MALWPRDGQTVRSDEGPQNLPAVPAGDEVEPEILDGEVVDDTPQADARMLRIVQVVRVVVQVVQVVQVVRVVVQHERTKTAGRHLGYIPAGIAVVFRRTWDSRSTARYERYLRAAEQTGNHEAALDWEERLADFRRDRHQRRMDLLEYPLKVLLVLPKALTSILMLYAVLGMLLAIASGHIAEAAVPVQVTAHVVLLAGIAISVSYGPVLLALPWLAIAVLWHVGRTAGTGPAWARTSADPDANVEIDERLLAQALEAMRIPQIRDYLKQGLPLQFITPCRQEGRGTYAQIRLPKVPAEKIVRRRADFAAGLYRLPKEVWPSTGSEAAILDVWIADKGALAEGAGPYPLLEDGFTDVFKGLPFGKTLRGDPIRIPVIGRNTICGGMPEQGKSSAARVVAAGYTLDIRTEIRIYVPDTNFDFEVFKPRCARYIMGAEDEHIEAVLGELEDLKDELQRRGQLLVDYEMPEVTPELASAGIGLHPLFVLLEEAHVAIQHHKHGKDIGLLLCDIVKLDRKRGAHVKVSTQAPTKDSMPRDVTRNCTNGIAFAVGDHVANDALLGQGAYAGGHRATELIPGTDRGTALCKGFNGQRSEIVQVHFLSVARDNDQVTPLIDRALTELARVGRAVPGTGRVRRAETRDLLADLDAVLGAERVKLADLPALLRDHAPAWTPYRALTGVQIGDQLDDAGVRTTKVGNVPRLDPADLRRVLAERREALGGRRGG
jgi:S-DNA-T family DNA segregation ATPase FtsK/SpoIIIE